MTLADVLGKIDLYDESHGIYVRPRWRPTSPAVVAPENGASGLPPGADGMTFMLTVRAARRAIAARTASRPAERCGLDRLCRAVIYLAVYDAPEPLGPADGLAADLPLAM